MSVYDTVIFVGIMQACLPVNHYLRNAESNKMKKTLKRLYPPWLHGTTCSQIMVMITCWKSHQEQLKLNLWQVIYSLGEEHYRDFITDWISQPTTDLFKPIKKLNLSTFSSLAVKSLVHTNSGKKMLKADHKLLACLLVIAQAQTNFFNLQTV